MDEMEKIEFAEIVNNCELNILDLGLAAEIKEILKEMYMNPTNRKKLRTIDSKKICYALENFAIANTKSRIRIPKSYFKKCILSALDQTELSKQYDLNTSYEMEDT